MADSEKSFSDRAQKSRQLHDACAGFAPVYAPPAGGTTLGTFMTKIQACETLNNMVTGNGSIWSEAVTQRISVTKTIKATTTQLINFIKGSTTWKSKLPAAQRFANAIRGMKPPPKPLPPPPPGTPPKKRRERGGQSFAELETNWRGLVTLATGLPGFAPTDSKIQASTLNGLLSSIKNLNDTIPGQEAALSESQQDRYKAYFEPEKGLEDLFKNVKTIVKGNYGSTSSQWAQVKGMKW
jgi:hypothetical protein